MITALEEAMDYADGIKSVIEMTLDTYEGVPGLTGVLYLLDQNMETLINLLAIVEAGEDMEDAPADEPTSTEANGKPTIVKNITYEEMMSKQHDESEGLHEAVPGTNDALDDLMDSAPTPKVDLKAVHQLRMSGKGAKEIAASFGVSVSTAYRWLDDIKKNRPMWAHDWVKAKEVKE